MNPYLKRARNRSRRPRSFALFVIIAFVLSACGQKPEQLLEEAREDWRREDYKAAAALYEQYLQQPNNLLNMQARYELADTYYLNLKNYQRAEFHFRMVIVESDRAPEGEELALNSQRRLAELAVKTGRIVEAIGEYEQLIRKAPEAERRELRLMVANLYYDRNDADQAELEYLKVTEEAPYDNLSEEAYLRIASIRHRLRKEYHFAAPIYEMISSNTKKESIVRAAGYGLAECYAADSQYTAAIKALKQLQPILSEEEWAQARRQIKEYKQRRKKAPQMKEMDWGS